MSVQLVGRAATLALLGSVSLSACTTSDGAPAAVPSSSLAPMPDPAKKGDRFGATSFASHWIDLVDYGYRTLDAAPIRAQALPTCQTCAQFVAQLDRDKAAGSRYQGGKITFLSAEPSDVRDTEQSCGQRAFRTGRAEGFRQIGALTETVPTNRTIFVFDLRWTDGGWHAAAIKLGMENTATPAPPTATR